MFSYVTRIILPFQLKLSFRRLAMVLLHAYHSLMKREDHLVVHPRSVLPTPERKKLVGETFHLIFSLGNQQRTVGAQIYKLENLKKRL